MKTLLFLIIFSLLTNIAFGQSGKHRIRSPKINSVVVGFLKWYKLYDRDTVKKTYSLIKGGYPDTTTKQGIDRNGVEIYLDDFRKSGFVSEAYIDNFRHYFLDIDKELEQR